VTQHHPKNPVLGFHGRDEPVAQGSVYLVSSVFFLRLSFFGSSMFFLLGSFWFILFFPTTPLFWGTTTY